MAKTAIFMADGTEECEALLCADILRRAGSEVTLVSVMKRRKIESSHRVRIRCDAKFEEMDFSDCDLLVLPGGMPGTEILREHKGLRKLLRKFSEQGKTIAAICAAPYILSDLGLLRGREATCHWRFRDKLQDAELVEQEVVEDGNFITAWGLGAAIPFALRLAEKMEGPEAAAHVRKGIDYVHPLCREDGSPVPAAAKSEIEAE
jgi:4-methyl-5(b-hydroxyethyl)-thiazole monophosphate biosynthesis